MELTISEQAEEEIKDRLLDLRKDAYHCSLCQIDPQKWLKVAIAVYRGDPVIRVKQEYGIGQETYYKIRKQILDIQNKYVEYQISNLDANMDAADEATTGMLEVLQDSVEDMKTNKKVDYDKAKAMEAVSSSLDRLQKSAVSMSMRKNKLLDKPDVVVEKRGPEIDYEARKKELLAIQKAEAIDVTENV